MDTQRKGEIACHFLELRLLKDKFTVRGRRLREIINLSEENGISTEEAVQFLSALCDDILEKAFPKRKKAKQFIQDDTLIKCH